MTSTRFRPAPPAPKINTFSTMLVVLVLCGLVSCVTEKEESRIDIPAGPRIAYTVRMTLQHDEKAYTQGLVIYQDRVFESTGAEESWIAELDLDKGTQEKKVVLDRKYFGEGITVLNNKLYQLTWKHKTGFIYDIRSFKNLGAFSYACEGWGLTTDGVHLLMSDGTDKIHYLDTLTFKVVKSLSITEHGQKVERINELEYIQGAIYANQWETNHLLKIDPQTEQVVARVDLSPLANEIKRTYPKADVLNGIGYNASTEEVLVTGKFWPRAYLIRLH